MLSWIEWIGALAGLICVIGLGLRAVFPLRLMTVLGAALFAAYGVLSANMWVAGLSLVAVAVCAWRLWQARRIASHAGAALHGHANVVATVQSLGSQADFTAGAAVFRRGEPVNAFYIIESGKVQLQEVNTVLGQGDILGEIGFFTDAASRTATAVCMEPTRVYVLTKAAFRHLQQQDPDFSMVVMRTAMRRLADGVARNPAAYHGLVAPLRHD